MPRFTTIKILIARICLALGIAGCGCVLAQPTHPYPQFFPNFQYFGEDYAATLWVQPNGRQVLSGAIAQGGPAYAFAVVRLNTDFVPDRSFGNNGIVELPVWGAADYGSSVVGQPDGKLLVAGNSIDPSGVPACDYWAFCNNYIAIFRLNVDGSRDSSFNGSGRLVLHIGDVVPGVDETNYLDRILSHLELQPDGGILVHGLTQSTAKRVVARVLPDGKLDTTFVRSNSVPAVRAAEFAVAVEFYNTALDRYFVTADTSEIVGLQRKSGDAWHWAWVGGGFHVYPAGSDVASSVPVCRFYGTPEAGLGSHLLSANAAECADLEASAGDKWILESREVFRVDLPDPQTGACLPDRLPVYRLWSARADSSHHLTIDMQLRDKLLGQGYIAEGWGPLGVAMCAAP